MAEKRILLGCNLSVCLEMFTLTTDYPVFDFIYASFYCCF